MDWATSDHRPVPRPDPPPPTLLETCWRVKGKSGRTITCAIYETTAHYIELRAGYSVDHIIRTQLVGHIEHGRLLAADWLNLILALGGCEEVPKDVDQ
jgi:hypothetical protein